MNCGRHLRAFNRTSFCLLLNPCNPQGQDQSGRPSPCSARLCNTSLSLSQPRASLQWQRPHLRTGPRQGVSIHLSLYFSSHVTNRALTRITLTPIHRHARPPNRPQLKLRCRRVPAASAADIRRVRLRACGVRALGARAVHADRGA